jgi:hypothetical protein
MGTASSSRRIANWYTGIAHSGALPGSDCSHGLSVHTFRRDENGKDQPKPKDVRSLLATVTDQTARTEANKRNKMQQVG